MTAASRDAHATPPVTLKTLREMARAFPVSREPFACLTCYDASFARLLAAAGVHVLLVGDSAAEVILGHERTIHMPMELSLLLTAAVKRGAPGCVVMGDMPFMSYQADESDALRNAGRFMTEGRADIVKIEADASFAPLVSKMTRAGIPVCAHIGSKPQQAALTSGYARAGRTPEQARAIADDALALERAGAMLLLLEACPPEVTALVREATTVPLIGIGAGGDCHGQVLVLHDLLGLTPSPPPFARPLAHLGTTVTQTVRTWVTSLREPASNFPARPTDKEQPPLATRRP
jgi:3-methyl-2-oxobutanoate hydroxymethyltransferase